MNMDLTLAICMYNAEKYIAETLQCVVSQTMQDFCLVIVDDCCTDGSVDVVNDFFRKHPRQYKLVRFEENKGLAFGRRYVEENAETEYLLFVDADDRLYDDFVEKLYGKISSDRQLMAVGCYMEYINLKGEKMKGGVFIGETTKEGFYKKAQNEKLIFMASTSIYNRAIALSVGGHNIDGFPEGKPRYQDLCEDLDLWTRMSDLYKDGMAIVVIPQVLYQYRKGEGISSGALGMLLRMRHVKTNLKRRRRGDGELSFVDFKNSISDAEMNELMKEAKSVDAFRNAYYYLKKANIPLFAKNLFVSIYNNPRYMWDKIKNNLLKLK